MGETPDKEAARRRARCRRAPARSTTWRPTRTTRSPSCGASSPTCPAASGRRRRRRRRAPTRRPPRGGAALDRAARPPQALQDAPHPRARARPRLGLRARRRVRAPGDHRAWPGSTGGPVGVLASDPEHYAGGVTADASEKLARFVDICDQFHLPVVNFVDQPGFVIGTEAERAGTIRRGARALVRRLPGDACPWVLDARAQGLRRGGRRPRRRLAAQPALRLALGRLGLAADRGRPRGGLPARARGRRGPGRAARRDRRAPRTPCARPSARPSASASRRSSTRATRARCCATGPSARTSSCATSWPRARRRADRVPEPAPTIPPQVACPAGSRRCQWRQHRGWTEAHVRRVFWRAGFGATPREARHWARRGKGAAIRWLLHGGPPRCRASPPRRRDGKPLDPDNEWSHDGDLVARPDHPLAPPAPGEAHLLLARPLRHDRPGHAADAGAEPDAAPSRARSLPRPPAGSRTTRRCCCTCRWRTPTEAPNENYARELMELFTLGRGYSERDIREASRADRLPRRLARRRQRCAPPTTASGTTRAASASSAGAGLLEYLRTTTNPFS